MPGIDEVGEPHAVDGKLVSTVLVPVLSGQSPEQALQIALAIAGLGTVGQSAADQPLGCG
ncbi:hypothetical protein [Streptomyces sp. NPDC005078]|uniref:hypothetical protein n=1 Tax=unclassified Streptomyces TaxID=2593676 RepID=UPI0033B55D60